MKKYSRHFSIAGLVLIIAGALGYGMAPQFKGFHVIPWALAALCLCIYVLYNLGRILTFSKGRSARYGAGSLIATILFTGIIILVAVLTLKHNWRVDLTENKRFSLAPQSLKVLAGLDTDVKVTGFFQGEGSGKPQAKSLLDQYAYESDKFKYELVDPDRNPARAKAAGITKYDIVVVEAAGRSEQLTVFNEERLTNAIVRLINPNQKTIYFLTGHGERDIEDIGKDGYSSLKTNLENQNYNVKSLLLMQESKMPEDTAVLVIAGPKKEILPAELQEIEKYLSGGGKIFFLVDPGDQPGLTAFLKKFNVILGKDYIVDKMSRLFGGDYLMPLSAQYTQHPITEGVRVPSFFPLARSVSVSPKKTKGVKVVPLAATSDQSWAEVDIEGIREGRAEFSEVMDQIGPIPVAVVGKVELKGDKGKKEKTIPLPQDQDKKKAEGKFIVFGDSDFASNQYLNLQGNGDLFFASLSWLAEEADLIAIRPKEAPSKPLMLTQMQARMVFWIPVVLMPLLVLAAAVMVLTSRRRRQ